MLTEYIIYQPAQGNWPDLEWGRAPDRATADYSLALHRRLHPGTRFELRVKTYG